MLNLSSRDHLFGVALESPSFNQTEIEGNRLAMQLDSIRLPRVRQADGEAWRNVLLAQTQRFAPRAGNDPERAGIPILYGEGSFAADEVSRGLARLGLPDDERLTPSGSRAITGLPCSWIASACRECDKLTAR